MGIDKKGQKKMVGNTDSDKLIKLVANLKTLFAEREWDGFHTPKSLAMNLMIESGELAEFFTWISDEKSRDVSEKLKEKVTDEVGDVFLTLVYFCDMLGIDIFEATFNKIEKIKKKYPVELFTGVETKFSVNS